MEGCTFLDSQLFHKQQTGSRFSLLSGHVTKVSSLCDEWKSNDGTFMMPFILELSTNSSILVKNLFEETLGFLWMLRGLF